MKTRHRIASLRSACRLGAGLLAALCSGCATNALLDNAAGGKWQPQSPDRLCLFTTATNRTLAVAIFFNQVYCGRSAAAPRPALWCLSHPDRNLLVDAAAIRRFTNSWSQVRTIPLFRAANDVPPGQSTAPPGYAVLCPASDQFLLRLEGFPPGPYTLPTTRVEGNTVMLLIGVPIALAVDVAIVCATIYVLFDDAGAFPPFCCN